MRQNAVLLAITSALLGSTALAEPASLRVSVSGVTQEQAIPEKYAYCITDGAGKIKSGKNINPQISWSGAPKDTKSFVLAVVDSEVPKSFASANRDDMRIASDAERRDFYHWVLFDIPANLSRIKEGQNSTALNPKGKPVGKTAYGINGRNGYSDFKERAMGGYDGPCPPWNDEKMHRYHFRVYALDTATLSLHKDATGIELMQAIAPHILAKGEVTGLYSLNVKLFEITEKNKGS